MLWCGPRWTARAQAARAACAEYNASSLALAKPALQMCAARLCARAAGIICCVCCQCAWSETHGCCVPVSLVLHLCATVLRPCATRPASLCHSCCRQSRQIRVKPGDVITAEVNYVKEFNLYYMNMTSKDTGAVSNYHYKLLKVGAALLLATLLHWHTAALACTAMLRAVLPRCYTATLPQGKPHQALGQNKNDPWSVVQRQAATSQPTVYLAGFSSEATCSRANRTLAVCHARALYPHDVCRSLHRPRRQRSLWVTLSWNTSLASAANSHPTARLPGPTSR